jgi:hypothetical protein
MGYLKNIKKNVAMIPPLYRWNGHSGLESSNLNFRKTLFWTFWTNIGI